MARSETRTLDASWQMDCIFDRVYFECFEVWALVMTSAFWYVKSLWYYQKLEFCPDFRIAFWIASRTRWKRLLHRS